MCLTPITVGRTLLALGLVLGVTGATRYVIVSRATAVRGYTGEEMCAASVHIVRRLTGRDGGFTLTPGPVSMACVGRPDGPGWDIMVADLGGRYLTHLVRDARTGEVVMIGQANHGPMSGRRHKMGAEEAISVGRRWLRDLDIGSPSPDWETIGAKHGTADTNWQVYYRSTDRSAWLCIDGLSGELIVLKTATMSPQQAERPGRSETVRHRSDKAMARVIGVNPPPASLSGHTP